MNTTKITTVKTTNYSTTSAITYNSEIIGYITHGLLASKTCWKSGGLQRQAGKRYWITNQDGVSRIKLQNFTEFRTRKAAIAKLIDNNTKGQPK